MQEEVKRYEEGRQKLAQLMNEDPENFSEAQVMVFRSQQTHSCSCLEDDKSVVSVLLCVTLFVAGSTAVSASLSTNGQRC